MTTGMYNSALQRQYFTIDYDLMLKETIQESKRLALNEGINEGILQEKRDNVVFLIKNLYNKDTTLWVKDCSLEQLDYIKELCFKDISYQELLEMKDRK